MIFEEFVRIYADETILHFDNYYSVQNDGHERY